jgi:hypothetical protein
MIRAAILCTLALASFTAALVADRFGPQRCSEVAAMSYAGELAVYRKCRGVTFGLTGQSTYLRAA